MKFDNRKSNSKKFGDMKFDICIRTRFSFVKLSQPDYNITGPIFLWQAPNAYSGLHPQYAELSADLHAVELVAVELRRVKKVR
jgi:hypothetical protein